MTSTNAAATAKIQSGLCLKGRERNVPGQYPTRAFLPENNTSQDFSKELEKGDQRAFLHVRNELLQQIKHASADDP